MVLLLLSLLVTHAQTSDGVTQDRLIEKLTQVNLNLAPNDTSKQSITLRLGDLHAERGRRLAMKELNEGCVGVCKAGDKDRQKAIKYYGEVLPQLGAEQKAQVLTQVGHLHELTGDESKAIAIYDNLLKDPNPKVAAEAQLSLAEIHFKKRNFPLALNFYQKVQQSHPTQKGLAGYRMGWCYLNMNQVTPAIEELKKVLKSPELLSRSGNGVVSVDKQFQEEVSRDLAMFISRRGFNPAELEELYALSPDNAKLAHMSYLASEYERLGQVPAAIASWRFVIQRQSKPQARLEGHVHLAQLQAQHQNRPEAMKDFETSLALWKQLGVCQDDTCKQLKVRLRKFVLDWNELEKKNPSKELLEAYQLYISTFNEADMRLWAAVVASQLKDHELAVQENLTAARMLTEQSKTAPLDKTQKEWLEAALLSAIENAELTKKAPLEDQATQAYLDMSLDRKKEMDVRYQRAHAVYEAAQYASAAELMKALALNAKAPTEVRAKSADLALDSLVLLKDDVRLEAWSKELSAALPKQASNFLSVARKSVLTQSTQLATNSNDLDKAWITLNRFDANGASAEEKTSYLKNKLILAEKLKKLPEARDAADQLLRQPGLSVEDTQFALSRKAWLAELQFDFAAALAATEKMTADKNTDSASRFLKMALLAELSQKDPAPYYKKFVQESKDKEKTVAVVAQIVKSSPQPLKDLETYKTFLAQKPEMYTEAVYEVFAKTGKKDLLPRITGQTQYLVTPYGKAALRTELLSEYQNLKAKLSTATIDSSNQKKLAAGLKGRVALLDAAEKWAGKAVDQQEWASQIVFLNLLASEHQRFYDEILSLPVPQGLSPEDEQQYLSLISQQAAPHQTKANDIKGKLQEIYGNKTAFHTYSEAVSAQPEVLKKVFVAEMEIVRAALPADQQALLNENRAVAGAAPKPSLADVEKVRQIVREQPFDGHQIENLMKLEKQLGRDSMVAYLQGRLETLKAPASIKQ